MVKLKESDMYEPIKNLLTSQGFIVRGEVKGCDIAAIKEGVLWIVEMKLNANITLIYQAMERQTATENVFIAIPRPKTNRDGTFRSLQKLLKKLNLGLITVALDSPTKHAEILFFPNQPKNKSNKKTEAITKEILGRTTDTTGGAAKTKINTAYRERCVRVACILEEKGQLRPMDLVNFGCERDAASILRLNAFGWFKNVKRGVYALTNVGKTYLTENEASSLVTYYRMKAKEII